MDIHPRLSLLGCGGRLPIVVHRKRDVVAALLVVHMPEYCGRRHGDDCEVQC
jgi:hypothetical protein